VPFCDSLTSSYAHKMEIQLNDIESDVGHTTRTITNCPAVLFN
jgi:hypothetical protein